VLAPLTSRFASFRDGPEERAAGALQALGTVTVAPAGNDGPSGLAAGTTGAPGGAASVLAVGAVDGRAILPRIDVTLAGEPGRAVLASPAAPPPGLALPIRIADGGGLQGAAALVERGRGDLRAQALAAAEAGAGALLLWGRSRLQPGALGVDDRLALPILALDRPTGERLATLLAAGGAADVVFGAAHGESNPAAGRVAAFSSTGLGGDGRVKPDLVAPGVTVVTALSGGGLTSVTGTSAAAAQAAGAVAALAAVRRNWSAERLQAAVVASAEPTADGVAAQGGGVIRPAAARVAPLQASPAALAFGRIDRATGTAAAELTVRNVSGRRLVVRAGFEPDAGKGAEVAVEPAAFAVTAGAAAPLALTLRLLPGPLAGDAVGGWVTLAAEGGPTVRVPVAAVVASAAPRLVRKLAVERAADVETGPVIAATVGEVRRGKDGAVRIAGVERLTVDVRAGGRRLGRLYEARQLLPGRHRFVLPRTLVDGQPLEPGRYRLRVVATGSDGARTVGLLRVTVRDGE
jgi:hypothetical protein